MVRISPQLSSLPQKDKKRSDAVELVVTRNTREISVRVA